MSSKKILVVLGATGNQGGSVVTTMLSDPVTRQNFHVRAVTRDPSKPQATALIEKGAEVAKADLMDKDSLRLAFKDAYAVFSVTNYFEMMDDKAEKQQGINVADIAKELNIQHLIWSSLPSASRLTNGRLNKMYHFESKAAVEEHIRNLGIPATFLIVGSYMSMTVTLLSPLPSKEGKKAYRLALPVPPTVKWAMVSAGHDVGKYVKAILSNREQVLGKRISAAERLYSLGELVQTLKEKGGLDVAYEQIPEEAFKKGLQSQGFPEFFADDMVDSMKFGAEFSFLPGDGVTLEAGHQILSDPLENYEEWVVSSEEVRALK